MSNLRVDANDGFEDMKKASGLVSRHTEYHKDHKAGRWPCVVCGSNVADPRFTGKKANFCGHVVLCPDCYEADPAGAFKVLLDAGMYLVVSLKEVNRIKAMKEALA